MSTDLARFNDFARKVKRYGLAHNLPTLQQTIVFYRYLWQIII